MRETRRTRLVLTLLVLTAFTLITLDFRAGSGSPFERLRGATSAAFGPVEEAIAAVVRPIGGFFSGLGELGSYKSKAARLEKENASLRAQLHLTDAQRRELADVDKLLGISAAGRFRIVGAHVVAVGGARGFEWTATIDVGSRDGIKPDMSVISGDGLVGRVKTVGPTSATVLLAIDPQSYVGARVAETGEIGYVTGGGTRPMTFKLLDPHVTLKKGMRLVTFGDTGGRPYVPAVPIGTITEIQRTPGALTRTALVRPFTRFTALDTVAVVVAAPRELPRTALLPTPTATASPPVSAAPSPSASAQASPGGSPGPAATPTSTPAG